MADIEEQVRGQQAVVGAHEAILQVTAVDLPGWGGEEALHAAALPAQPLGTWEAQGHVTTATDTHPAEASSTMCMAQQARESPP